MSSIFETLLPLPKKKCSSINSFVSLLVLLVVICRILLSPALHVCLYNVCLELVYSLTESAKSYNFIPLTVVISSL